MSEVKSICCGAKIIGVIDYGTLLGQLGCVKLRYCTECKLVLEGEGKGTFYEPERGVKITNG